jgi:hypothetical protein
VHVFKPLSLFGSEASKLVGSIALISPSSKFPGLWLLSCQSFYSPRRGVARGEFVDKER